MKYWQFKKTETEFKKCDIAVFLDCMKDLDVSGWVDILEDGTPHPPLYNYNKFGNPKKFV